MADERTFPDVEFVDTDTQTIVDEMVESYEENFGRSMKLADPEYMRILWIASLVSQERSRMNIAAKRNLPRYAEGEYLDSLAEIFYDITRQEAACAVTTILFTISEAATEDVLVPAGTEVTTDGTITFATDEDLTVSIEDLTGEVSATCTTAGTAGNGYPAGYVNSLVEQIAYVVSAVNTDTTAGGTEEETDDELYYRMRESYEGYSTAGTAGAYKYWAMKSNEAIADCIVTEGEPGWTIVTVLMDTGVPTDTELEELFEYLSSDEIRPLTDRVLVQAPEAVEFTIELTYYGEEQPSVGGEELTELVDAAIDEYVEWQTSKLGRDIDPGRLAAMIYQAGADWVRVTSPTEQELDDTQCAVLSGDISAEYLGEYDT